jgi:predicted ArsR family transcriptional regulator
MLPIMETNAVGALDVPLERDVFLRTLLRELSGTLQDVVGIEEAAGFVSVVGQSMGREIDGAYRSALRVDRLSREQVPEVLVDLKRRIQGDFYVISEDAEKIVLGNRRCPFGDAVRKAPGLCRMTSSVFGGIAARNMGAASVVLEERIAVGDPECRVTVWLTDAHRGRNEAAHDYGGVPAGEG